MTATAHQLIAPATRLPWSLLVLALKCGRPRCPGTIDLAHDGGQSGGMFVPDLAVISEGCTVCHRDLTQHDIDAINHTLASYREHGRWPEWTTERRGVLTVALDTYLGERDATVPDFTRISGTSHTPQEPAEPWEPRGNNDTGEDPSRY